MAQPTTPDYRVNYDDERFGQVESDKNQALTELEQTYGGMIGQTDQYYQQQIDATKQWAQTQQQNQQAQSDFAIEQIQQQKDQSQKDYIKEQSGAYADWQKQSNQYGVAAEQAAASGMTNTGFSESSQVAMFNQYQNRVMTARDVYQRAVLNYDNAIKDARLQNNSVLAEIAYNALQKELELSLASFQYKNNLILEQANKKVELENTYYNRYLDVLNQINQENALAEEVRQYEQNFAFEQEQFAEQVRQYNEQYQLELKQMNEQIRQYNQSYQLQLKEYNEGIRQFNEEIARLKAKDAKEYELEIKNLELKKQQLAEEKRQYEKDAAYKQQQLQLQKDQLEEEKRQYDSTLEYNKSKDSGGRGVIDKDGEKETKPKGVVEKPRVETYVGKNNNSNKVTIDTDSLMKAGISPMVSDSYLATLVSNGTLTVKQVGNKLVFSKPKNSKVAAGQAVLDRYTTVAKRAYK